MKRVYNIFFSIGVVAVFLLQSLYIRSLYHNFLLVEQQNIESSIYEAIDLELHHREVKSRTPGSKVKYQTNVSGSRITLEQMPKELQVAMRNFLGTVKIPKYDWINIQDLIDRGVIRSTGDLQNQQNQDWYIEKGNLLNIHILDSLFRSRIDRNYKSRLCLLDETDCTMCIEGDSVEYNYTTRKFPIGLKGKQSIIAEVDITPSYFIKISVVTLVLSFLILLFSLLSLLYFIIILRRKDKSLKRREININGVIHDLKSPLAGVYAMLDLYHLMEQDEERKSSYKRNMQRVKLICTNIERLLATAKDEIEITKTTISRDLLIDRIETLVEGLKVKHRDKDICTTTYYSDFEEINIDTISLDCVITNLVENAIKYSSNRVNISIVVNLYNERLHIVVSDDGMGIAHRDQRQIFNYLYRGSNVCNDRGMGIGLAYIKAVAQAHGGNAKLVASEVDKGSKFEVILNVKL